MVNFNKKGFTILELLLVVLIISVLAGVGGSSYYAAAKNSRIEKEAREIANFIQEARSMAIDKVIKVRPTGLGEMEGYEVEIKNDTTDQNIKVVSKMVYKDINPTIIVPHITDLNEWESKTKFKFENIVSVPVGFTEPIKLLYEFGSGDLVIKDSFVKLDFDVLDELTNRKITFSLNRISGLLETR